jgi:hypothetical protein
MKELALGLTAIVLTAAPAHAGGDDYYSYGDYGDHRGCCVDTYAYDVGTVYAPRDYAPRVYVPYGYVYSAEPEFDVYGADCTVTRKYRHGHVREKIECDDDD